MDDEDSSQSDLARKRTARVQLGGGLEARAYVEPTPVPIEAAHKTIEMRTVAVDESLDPRKKATVARGMGEALAVLEGEVVDPTTGQVIPAVDPKAVPDTPWAHGKRPTHLKGAPPTAFGAAGAGRGASTGPGYAAYFAAGGIVVAAIACVAVIFYARGTPTSGDAAAPGAPTSESTVAASARPGPAAPTALPTEPTARPVEPSAPSPTPEPESSAPTPPSTAKVPGPLPGKATPTAAPTPAPAKTGDRIF